MKKYFAFILMLCLAMLTACSTSQKGEDKQTVDTEQTKTELVVNVGTEPEDGFDPIVGWGRYGSPLFQSTLFKRDNALQLQNDLATGYDISENGLVWTVRLREDVLFNDGTPLTAKDVVFTYEKAMENASVVDLTNLSKVEADNDYSVAFTLKQPNITFINQLVSMGIVPSHAYSEHYANQPLVGSGPFQFVQWDKGQQLIIEKNDLYYGQKPYFKKIIFVFLDQDAAFFAAKSGQLDITPIPATFANESVDTMDLISIDSVDNRGISFPYVKADSTFGIGNDVTSDLAIRQAIDICVDRQELIDGVLNGYGTPASSICDGLPWFNEQTAVSPTGDIEKAKQILQDGGWVDKNADGILEKESLEASFTLYYPANDSIRQGLAIAISDRLKTIGIQMHIDGKSWDEIERVMHQSPVLMGWGGYDALEMYNVYSSTTRGEGYYNNGYYSNSTVDTYMEQALSSQTEEEANENWKKAQWDGQTGFSSKGDVAWSWLVNVKHLYLVSQDIEIGEQRIQPHGHGWPITYNIEQWKLKE